MNGMLKAVRDIIALAAITLSAYTVSVSHAQTAASDTLVLETSQTGEGPEGSTWTYQGREHFTNVWRYTFTVTSSDGASTEFKLYSADQGVQYDRKVHGDHSVEMLSADDSSIELKFTSLPRTIEALEEGLLIDFVAKDSVVLPSGRILTYRDASFIGEGAWIDNHLFVPLTKQERDTYALEDLPPKVGSNQKVLRVTLNPTRRVFEKDVATELEEVVLMETDAGALIRKGDEFHKIWIQLPNAEPVVVSTREATYFQLDADTFLIEPGKIRGVLLKTPKQKFEPGDSAVLKRAELVRFQDHIITYQGSGHAHDADGGGTTHFIYLDVFKPSAMQGSQPEHMVIVHHDITVIEDSTTPKTVTIGEQRYRIEILEASYDKSVSLRLLAE